MQHSSDYGARLGGLLLALAPFCTPAQQTGFTLAQVLGTAFPSELTASPAGGKVAWVSNARGVRNIMMAEPPEYHTRALTSYTADDGQELGSLSWKADGSAVVYVRGGGANRQGWKDKQHQQRKQRDCNDHVEQDHAALRRTPKTRVAARSRPMVRTISDCH